MNICLFSNCFCLSELQNNMLKNKILKHILLQTCIELSAVITLKAIFRILLIGPH